MNKARARATRAPVATSQTLERQFALSAPSAHTHRTRRQTFVQLVQQGGTATPSASCIQPIWQQPLLVTLMIPVLHVLPVRTLAGLLKDPLAAVGAMLDDTAQALTPIV
eukprot:COSAG06_NODE_26557_length_612_cov_0.957115_1_plen_108_part_01